MHLATPRKRKTPAGQRTAPPRLEFLSSPVSPTTPKKPRTPSKSAENSPYISLATPRKWTRVVNKVDREVLSQVTHELFGVTPRPWQLDLAERVLEGTDAIGIAGTGSGKSLVFAILAIAAELGQGRGLVVVISPLKALQNDQVRRFNKKTELKSVHAQRVLNFGAVAINEDNKDDSVFRRLGNNEYRICYASPEILLRNQVFKQLFRDPGFRRNLVAVVVDEAHVIQDWKTEFRKDYGELETLRVLMGSEIPWLALSGTCPTETFQTIYKTLGMGGARRLFILDLGTNRPNLRLWVRPMKYSPTSLWDLLSFLPHAPLTPNDFVKAIFYFKTRQQARDACDLLRAALPSKFQELLLPFTAIHSEEYKEECMERFMKGVELRWLFATLAAGMGTDVPDVEMVVVFGVDEFTSAFQKGGRAGRSPGLQATMIWLVEPWAFNPDPPAGTNEKITASQLQDQQRREKMDQHSREFINRSQSNKCMRTYACTHFRPQPKIRGLPWGDAVENDAEDPRVHLVAHEQVVTPGPACGCSAKICRPLSAPQTPVGLLTDGDHRRVIDLLKALGLQAPTSSAGTDDQSHAAEGSSSADLGQSVPPMPVPAKLSCTKVERATLHDQLTAWRDKQWANMRAQLPMCSRDWILGPPDIKRIVEKAHIIVNSPTIDEELLKKITTDSFMMSEDLLRSLIARVSKWKEGFFEARRKEGEERKGKRRRQVLAPEVSSAVDDPFCAQPVNRQAIPTAEDSIHAYSQVPPFQIHGYRHD
ncbi:hypothetical protein D9611_012779 [Ephemerocybe angulata]|uniref:DNA 3'-5' helicase n=1 Tax=Ephemerocybe angulata TaxID=980116 RepID=A0A8H5FFK0_9AGAR|nr:hypothetical protein D9611_010045 [Tulosesus angulatus]KAF5338633.1 hypothetical protein D9611_012779 [Tulosesus angulatus]